MKEGKGGKRILLKNKREKSILKNVKTSAILAVFVMVASALIVTGSGWSFRDPNPILKCQVGDIEPCPESNPWDEFTRFKAPPYERDYNCGDCPNQFPAKTAPYCKGFPNEVNIHFTADFEMGGKLKFRWTPGYNGNERIKLYLDGRQIKVYRDKGGHDNSQYCTYKYYEHEKRLPKDRLGETEHVLTILHDRGNGGLWDWIQIWQNKPLPKSDHTYTIKWLEPLQTHDGFKAGQKLNIKFWVLQCNKFRWVHDESIHLWVKIKGYGVVYQAWYGHDTQGGNGITINDPANPSGRGKYKTQWQTEEWMDCREFIIGIEFSNGFKAVFT